MSAMPRATWPTRDEDSPMDEFETAMRSVCQLAAKAVRQANRHHRMAYIQAIKSALSVAQSKLSDQMREEQ